MTEPATDEALLLDLLNSTPIIDGTRHDLLAASPHDWLTRHGGSGAGIKATIDARALLQRVVRGDAPASSLEALLRGVRSVPVIEDEGVTWTTVVPQPKQLAVRAVLAWDELRRVGPGRLRPCANPDCALFLIDHSKPNRARWCSMAVCGNRMKARRHYERTRATS